ncbi:MAG: hypothetical protein U0Q12_26155 [Vicinamibacterales bacterium]
MEYLVKHYGLEQGALEIQYIEEHFGEFPQKKTASEIIRRLAGREHQIVMAEAALSDDPGMLVPVSFKVSHELSKDESEPELCDLVGRLTDVVDFEGRRVLYNWLGGTRTDWRGQGHFRALTEEQETWAIAQGFDELLVKTKNKFHNMRSTLAQLGFEVVHFERAAESSESKIYLSKRLGPQVLNSHRSARTLVKA